MYIALLGLLLQVEGMPAPVEPACRVLDGVAPEARTAEQRAVPLYAACGAKAVWLGEALSHRSAYHGASGSLLVEVQSLQAGKRVLLISQDGTGTLHIDDVSRELTRLSGRYAEAGLAQVAVDLSGFAATGAISVPVTRMPAAPQGKAMAGGAAAPRGAAAAAESSSASVEAQAASGTATLDLKPYAARTALIGSSGEATPDAGTSDEPQ